MKYRKDGRVYKLVHGWTTCYNCDVFKNSGVGLFQTDCPTDPPCGRKHWRETIPSKIKNWRGNH